MKVCLISSYPPSRARLSEYAYNLVDELKRRPGIGELYVLSDGDYFTDGKLKVLKAWEKDDPLSLLTLPFRVIKLRPHVAHFNIHFQSFGRGRVTNFVGFLLIPLLRLLGIKVLVTIHNLGERVDLTKLGIKAGFINRMGITVATKLLLKASGIAVTVRSYGPYLRQRYGHNGIRYVPHGARPYDTGLPSNGRILMFGHMSPYKGLHVMLEAFKRLNGRKDVELIVAGSSHPNYPGYLERFRDMRLPKVSFIGYVPEKRLPSLFSSVRVVALPYLMATGTSGVFHLACSFGRPIVASDLPEIRELVMDGASALLVPPGDVKALANAVSRLLEDDELARSMAFKNLMFAKRYSWSMVAKAYERMYEEATNGGL